MRRGRDKQKWSWKICECHKSVDHIIKRKEEEEEGVKASFL
jgi:hypothetical protein